MRLHKRREKPFIDPPSAAECWLTSLAGTMADVSRPQLRSLPIRSYTWQLTERTAVTYDRRKMRLLEVVAGCPQTSLLPTRDASATLKLTASPLHHPVLRRNADWRSEARLAYTPPTTRSLGVEFFQRIF